MSSTLVKDPDRDTRYEIDARRLIFAEMRRDRPYAEGAIVKAPRHTGFYYECTASGETKHNWPDLPRADGETVQDGSVEWTARHPSSSSLPTVASVSWAVDASGLTVPSHDIEGGLIFPTLSGGTDGESYEVTATITWPTGQVDDLTFTVEVGQQ